MPVLGSAFNVRGYQERKRRRSTLLKKYLDKGLELHVAERCVAKYVRNKKWEV